MMITDSKAKIAKQEISVQCTVQLVTFVMHRLMLFCFF